MATRVFTCRATDAIEAAARTVGDPTPNRLREMIRRVANAVALDGQFDECDLTLRDLDRTRESFIEQLLAMYHRRIAYPTNKIVELESRRLAGRKGA